MWFSLLACSNPVVSITPLSLLMLQPSDGATGLEPDMIVSATFSDSQPIDPHTVSEGTVFMVALGSDSGADLAVPCNVFYEHVGDLMLVPKDPLNPGVYRATLGADLAGISQGTLGYDVTTEFEVGGTLGHNEAPSAVIADPKGDIEAGAEVALDGTASTDPEGRALTYTWTLIEAPPGKVALVPTADGSTATLQADTDPGTIIASLTVNDGVNDSDAAYVQLLVVPAS